MSKYLDTDGEWDDGRWWLEMVGSASWCDDELVSVDDGMMASPFDVSSLENSVLTIPLNNILKALSLYSCGVAGSKLMVGDVIVMLLLLSI